MQRDTDIIRKEQIEEMAKLIQTKEIHPCDDDVHCEDCYCACKGMAEMIYNAGYRKGETVSYNAMIEQSYIDRVNQLEQYIKQLEVKIAEVRTQTRKETAEEIFKTIINGCTIDPLSLIYVLRLSTLDRIKIKYGVEAEK